MPGKTTRSQRERFTIAFVVNLVLIVALIPVALFLGDSDQTIISEIRMPRVATAIAAGIALALAGALTQAIFVNPIIEPSFLGISSGAALGAVLGVIFGVAEVGSISTIPFAILGSLLPAFLILQLSKGRSSLILILNGIAITAITTALVGALIGILDRNDIRSFSFWSFGSFALADWNAAITIAISILVALIFLIFTNRGLDLLSLGQSRASLIGVDLPRLRLMTFAAIALLVAATVSTIGSIAFIGLASAHIARLIAGPEQKRLLPLAGLISANLLLLADTFARRAFFPQEIPIGFVIAMIAGPILIFALRNQRVWNEL